MVSNELREVKPEFYPLIDVKNYLPAGWQKGLIKAIRESAKLVMLPLDNPTVREEDFVGKKKLPSVIASGEVLAKKVPWIEDFYKNTLLNIVRSQVGENVICLPDLSVAITANVLGHNMRFETHEDFWPIGANLYIHIPDSDNPGGELLISDRKDIHSFTDILNDPDIKRVSPTSGTVSVVRLRGIAHIVGVVGPRRSEISKEDRFDSSSDMTGYMGEKAFEIPNTEADWFWYGARISLNFNFTTPEFNEELATSGKSPRGVADYQHQHGKK